MSTDADGCTAGCTSEREIGDFAAMLAAILALPISDAEKADAVRRLLAGK